ncbi:MAG: hypothetical protein Q8N05_15560 [Bacteroidota bacterium]|nr:hypothetical protein [Bacteroidota bacterium]
MNRKITISLVVAVIICCGGCTNTRYLTDRTSIERQHDMKVHRAGGNVGDVLINFGNFFIAAILNSGYEVYSRERAFKRISIVNQSTDSLYVNMVTDIVWKENGYCDIMGIALPPGAKQKLLVPYPAAYNVYFRTPSSEEEKLEIRTDSKLRIINLEPGMTKDSIKNESSGGQSQ